MRRENEKPRKFKNSVFVEFASAAEMNAFLDKAKAEEPCEDGGHGVKYGETKLQVMSKPAYVEMKMKEKGIDPDAEKRNPSKRGPRKFNAFRELEKEQHSQQGAAAAKSLREEPLEFEYNGKTLTTRKDGSIDEAEVVFPERSVLRFTGASQGGSWKDLKDTLSTLHPTSFVEFPADATEGAVGFREPVSDDKLADIQNKGITVGGSPVSWERVSEDKARDFYVERAKFRANYLLDRRDAEHNAPRGGRSGRGGRQASGDKRKRQDAPPEVGAKRAKEE